ncbi:hypothetical protein FGO68_gene1350 [Halteria grandinella]|uniref:Uncharacterized protein n=1 Tax=Halteria grandinella TaxID=5974 RepID=A0A8J8NND7_HALGN|nr:hypothetical protein FGO68_gene1350 [Halteria grandinella]
MRILFLFAISLSLFQDYTQGQVPAGCDGVRNTEPLLYLTPQPLKTVQNGQSWLIQQDTNVIYLAKVKGTPYQMGYALGQLYGKEIAKNIKNLANYGYFMFKDKLNVLDYLTEWQSWLIFHFVIEPLVLFSLDVDYLVTWIYTPERYAEEMRGIVAGSGGKISYRHLQRFNLFAELSRAHCTILGAWGDATADGKLYHLRTLDWNPTAKVNEFPAIIIYEPSEAGSQQFANIGYLGLIGSLTAMSRIGISVGEKVMYRKDGIDYNPTPEWTYFGKPWLYVLRDTIQFATNLQDVENMLLSTQRTAMIHLGFASVPDNTFRGVDYSSTDLIFYDDSNYTRYSSTYHPQYDGIFYYDRHVQPSGSTCIKSILDSAHGSITPETLYRDVTGYHASGDASVVVMDPAGGQLWLSYSLYGAELHAYKRSPIYMNLNQFWDL